MGSGKYHHHYDLIFIHQSFWFNYHSCGCFLGWFNGVFAKEIHQYYLTMKETKDVINNFLIHLQNRDLEKVIDLFAEAVKWDVPGDTKHIEWLGKRQNKAEIEEFYKLLWKETEPISAEIHNILIENECIIIKGSFNTKMLKTGNLVSSIFFIQLTIQKGKIVEYTLLEDSYTVSQLVLE